MPRNVMVDLGKLKTLYSGLGQFSYYFGKNLVHVHHEDLRWHFLTPHSFAGVFGNPYPYESLSVRRRYFPGLCPDYDLWHAIHQDSAFLPGDKKTIYILTIHDLNFLREKSSFRVKTRLDYLQRKVNRASYVTFISNFTASEAKKYLDLGNKPTRVIYNGVEIDTGKEVRRPKYLPEGKFLLALGMILEKKNFHVLIGFLDQLEGYHLVIAGDKSYSYGRRLQREVKRKKLEEKILMPGIISQEDKIYLYRHCEAFLFPSLNEGFGLPVIEAMRFGKPVFISRFSSLPEIGGELACYWDSFDPGHMAEVFNREMEVYEKNKSGLSGKLKNYSEQFTWEKSIQAYSEIYAELLQLKSKPVYQGIPAHAQSRKSLKVLHLSSERDWRGGEQQIAYLVGELNQLGIDNLVACERHSRFEKLCKTMGWNFFTAGFSSSLNLGTAYKVARVCRKNHIDILHLHTSKSHTVGVLSTWFGHRAKLILTRRVDNPIGKNFLSRWKYNHLRIMRIITVSDKIKEVVSSVLREPAKCITIHSGIDTTRFSPGGDSSKLRKLLNCGPGEILIGNTSALARHKDYFTFINTCSWLKDEGFKARFVIIGEGPEEAGIRNFISSRGLDSLVTLTGFRNDIPEILPGLDIFLMTSVTEGLGTSVLDAFAAGIPVVATRAGGIPEMVVDGETGLLADPGDFESLGRHIIKLSSDPELRGKLIRNAGRRLLDDFTKETMAAKVSQVYNEILS